MSAIQFRRQVLESVDSSNNVVKQALEAGEPEGLAIQARCQTGGYGRQGRGWSSPRGGMYLSLLLRPSVSLAQLPTLSLVTGLAVRDALRSLVRVGEGRHIAVKWPNDVVFCEDPANPIPARVRSGGEALDKRQLRKMCGISLESHAGGICIGIGVNVFPAAPTHVGLNAAAAPTGEVPVAGNRPLYLAELGYGHTCEQDVAVDAVAQAVLGAFAPRYSQWLKEGFAPFATPFADSDPLYGKHVQMVDVEGHPLVSGIAQGIDNAGNLLVLTEASLRPISFGEAHLV